MINIETENVVQERSPNIGTRFKSNYFSMFLKKEKLDTIKKDMNKKRDKRQDWAKSMYQCILQNINFDSAFEDFDVNKITKEYPEVVIAMANKLKEVIDFDETPKQQGLDEFPDQDAIDEDLKKKRTKKSKKNQK